jgi:hypothetical protein
MKVMSFLLGSILLILGILTLLAPKDFLIERTTTINKPIKEVFDSIKLLKSHEEWNSWSKKDPNMRKEFIGVDGTIGFKSSWQSEHEEVGTAEQEITNIIEGKRFDTVIHFKKPFEGNFESYLITDSINETDTKVILGMHDSMKFPMTVVSFIVNDCLGNRNKIQSNMDASLKNLKEVLEKK